MQIRVYLLWSRAAALCYRKGTWFAAKELLTKRRGGKKRVAETRRHCFCLKAVGCQLGSVRALPFSQDTFLPQLSLRCEPCLTKQGRRMAAKVLITGVYEQLWQRRRGPRSRRRCSGIAQRAGHLPDLQLGRREMPTARTLRQAVSEELGTLCFPAPTACGGNLATG